MSGPATHPHSFVEKSWPEAVTSAPEIWAGALDSLDGETTTCGRSPVKKATPMLVKRSQPDHLT